MQVEVIVFEDYEIIRCDDSIEYIRENREVFSESDFILPVGKPIKKVLELKDIKKAFNRFINIKTTKDAVRFAKKYGLLGKHRVYSIYEHITEILRKDYNEYLRTCPTPPNNEVLITSYSSLKMSGLYKDKFWTELLDFPQYPDFYELVFDWDFDDEDKFNKCLKVLGEYYEELRLNKEPKNTDANSLKFCMDYLSKHDKYQRELDEYYRKLYNENFIHNLGEKLSLNKESKNIDGSWKFYIDYFNKKARALLQKENIEFDNADEKIDEVLKDYMGEPKEKDVKLQYTIRKARKKGKPGERYFVETSIKFNSLLDAFDALWFFAGGVLKQCVTCGRIFVAERSTAKYCSESCKKKAHSARKSR